MTLAEEDLQAARHLESFSLYNTSCYHAQQAAEKYLKAILCDSSAAIPKVHNLLEIVHHIIELGIHVDEFVISACHSVNAYAIVTRYPGYVATEEDAKEAIRESKSIASFVFNYFKGQSVQSNEDKNK